MKIRIWNAYASNNSGSYTIVGLLPSEDVALEVAAALTTMIEAHTAWHGAWDGRADTSASPLAAFCRERGLTWEEGTGGVDDWPEHSGDNRPRVLAVGHQVVVHHDYTVSLPPTFGEFFYKSGGRVQNEENHSHHSLVAICSLYWPGSKAERAGLNAERAAMLSELTAADGPLAGTPPAAWPPAWQGKEGSTAPALTLGAIFADLVEGVAAVRALAEKHGAKMHVEIFEPPSEEQVPFAHLRPSTPAPSIPRYDLVVAAVGEDRLAVVNAMNVSLSIRETEARKRLVDLPATVARALPAPRAEQAAAALRTAGASVELVPSDA